MKSFKLTPLQLKGYEDNLTKIELTSHARSRWVRLGLLNHEGKLHNKLIVGVVEYCNKQEKYKVNLINSDGILYILDYETGRLLTAFQIKPARLFAMLKNNNVTFTKDINNLFSKLKDLHKDHESVEYAKQMGYI